MPYASNGFGLVQYVNGVRFHAFHRLVFNSRCQTFLKIIAALMAIYIVVMMINTHENGAMEVSKRSSEDTESHCLWSDNMLANDHGRYSIRLCYNSVVPIAERPQAPLISEMKIKKNGTERLLNFEQLAEIADEDWMEDFDRSVYDLYPQSNAEENIRRILRGLPILEPPINNPQIRFIQIPSHTCAPLTTKQPHNQTSDLLSTHDIVIVYKSAVYNFQSREILRKLYNSANSPLKISVVYSIGLPRTSGSNVFQRDGFNVTLKGRSGAKMEENAKNTSATKSALEKEMLEHDDLLVGDYEDTYYNLTSKLFYSFQWAARFCRPYKPILIFMDDDYAVNVRQLAEFLKSKTPEQKDNLRYAYKMSSSPVIRKDSYLTRWAVSKREIPWIMHANQHLGIYSMWSYRFVHDMALAMHFTKPLVIDDVYLALVQQKLHIDFSRTPGMYVYAKRSQDINCTSIMFGPVEEIIFRNCTI